MISGKKKVLLIAGMVLGLGLFLAACGSKATPTACPAIPPAPEPLKCPSAAPLLTPAPTQAPAVQAPFEDLWKASGHAQKDAAAFTHWDTASPAEIPVTCAKCHSSPGFQDYVGADGSEAFKVDKAAPIGTVITCETCHNAATLKLSTVKFPSGAEVTGLGREAVCMTCHQGRASGATVDAAIKTAAFTDDDTPATPDQKVTFTNIHYFAAAVSRYGTVVKGGYEYPGKSYDAVFNHVLGYQTCIDCHNPHSTAVKVDECKVCHTGVAKVEDLKNIRMNDSLVDYNGNGDVKEGLYYEVDGLRNMLLQAIQNYAKEIAKAPIVYDAATNPYFFIDTNANGKADKEELTSANAYTAWTARLLKAAFNYQTSIKDPGGYAHGAKYIIELLYDSIDDLNSKATTQVDLSKAHRISAGHFAGSATAFRDWDAAGAVPGTCARCHSGEGLPQFLKNGAVVANPTVNGLLCETCHDDLVKFTRYQVKTVPFPNGASLTFNDSLDSNLCIECHQGRESTVSVNAAINKLKLANDDTMSKDLKFLNIHYFAAGATLFGTQAKGLYEYNGKVYAGKFEHVKGYEGCADCHDAHSLQPKLQACKGCHNTDDPTQIAGPGDKEPLAATFETMKARLLEGVTAYAKDVAKAPIVYSPASYPYWFIDTNGNGKADPDELKTENAYVSWTPRLLKAAYNYQASVKDPGAFVHNHTYVFQVLYDSIADLQTKVPGLKLDDLTRPAVPAASK